MSVRRTTTAGMVRASIGKVGDRKITVTTGKLYMIPRPHPFEITAEHRQKAFGHQIVVLDPFKVVTQTPQTFNPLDFIDKDSPTAIDECRDLAEACGDSYRERSARRTGWIQPRHGFRHCSPWLCTMASRMTDRCKRCGRCCLVPKRSKWRSS